MGKNLYIVMHDFSSVGDVALNYALHLGRHIQTEIQVLHLVSTKEELVKAQLKMNSLIDSIDCPVGIELTKLVKVGSIFEDVGKIAKQEGAQLIVMGTHGAKGMQKLLGSNAMKVITSSEIPFLVVQKDTSQ